jgi:hypothetical protein
MCFTSTPSLCSASTSIWHCVDFPARSSPSKTISFPRAIATDCVSCEWPINAMYVCRVDGRGCAFRVRKLSERGETGVCSGVALDRELVGGATSLFARRAVQSARQSERATTLQESLHVLVFVREHGGLTRFLVLAVRLRSDPLSRLTCMRDVAVKSKLLVTSCFQGL